MTRASHRGAQRAALSNGDLVRYVLAVALNVVAEWAIFIGVLVYAFDDGGANATGYAAIAMLLPYVFFAPIAGAASERYPPQRVRIGAMAFQTLAFSVGTLAAFRDLPTEFVVAACMVGVAVSSALGPAGAVLRPAIVRSSRELTVANLWVGYADSFSVLAGPLLATLMLWAGGAPAVIAACAAVTLLALLITLSTRPPDPPGGSLTTDRIGAVALMRRNLAEVRSRDGVSGVMTVVGGQYFVVGALDIVIVVAAESTLELGDSGPGVLSTMFGLGAVLSSGVSTVLVRRRHLAPVLIGALAATGVATIMLGATMSIIAALILLPVIGLTRAETDLLGTVLLQRSAPPEMLASVFAVIELAAGIGLILGSISAQVLIASSGVEAALYGIGVFFLALLALTWRSLRVADASADVPVVAMSLLRRLSVFEVLPRPELEAVARASVEVPVEEGGVVITQGDHGDRFYAVAEGRFAVTVDDALVQTIDRGGSFGEIALLADVPRMATVTAVTPGSLLAIDSVPFLVAVTGHDSSRQAAWGVVHSMTPEHVPEEESSHTPRLPAVDDDR